MSKKSILYAANLSINQAVDEFLNYIFRRENKIFINFFFKFKIWEKGILVFFYTLLMISLRKINIFKKIKMDHIELT